MPSPNILRDNIARVCERIEAAAARAGRNPSEITLIGVSKTHPAEMIRAAYEVGLREFGENRVQEWEGKRQALTDLADARWHLIGHLQSNKATRAATIFHSVDSVDDAALAQRLDRTRQGTAAAQQPLRVLLEACKKFPRGAFFDPVAQSQELLFPLVGCCSGRAFNAVHGVGADGARHFYLVIHHREQHDHSVKVVSLKVTLRERHRRNSLLTSAWPSNLTKRLTTKKVP